MLLDSVKIYLPQFAVPELDLLAEVPAGFDHVTCHTCNDRIAYSGYLDNMYWSVRADGLSIKGNLSKFILGNNYTNLDKQSCINAFNELSDRLSLCLDKARLNQLDFGITFDVDHNPSRYFKYLGTSKYYKSRSINNSTLNYSNTKRSKHLYDKSKELKKQQKSFPSELTGKHLMRFEVRYRKQANKYFDRDPLTVSRLFESNLFDQLKIKLALEFESIERVRHTTLDTSQVKKASDFKSFIAADALANKGLTTYLALIEECDGLDTQYKSRAKAYCKELSRSFVNDRGIDLYDELAEKFNATLNTLY